MPRAGLLVLAIFAVAMNLRAPLASLPPLVHTIQRDLGLSSAMAGLLSALPLLCMGLFAPLAQRLAHSIGREATVAVALAAVLVGDLLRLDGEVLVLLIASCVMAGIGIALCGTILPGIVKEHFAERSGIVTGVYLVAMMSGASAASALSVPIADALGSWERSLAVWSALAVVGLIAWAPVMRAARRRGAAHPAEAGAAIGLPHRSGTAWVLAAYMALQSISFYSQLAWIPPSYEDRGWSARDAGLLLALWAISQLASAIGGPAIADRVRDRRPLIAVAVSGTITGLVGITWAPDAAPVLWVVLLSLGQGGGFALGLVKLVDYAPSPAASARLTALVFGVAFSVASLGPFLFGAVHDATGEYATPYAMLLLFGIAQMALVPLLRPGRLTEPA